MPPITSSPKKPKQSNSTPQKPTRSDAPIINEEADRILGRMTLQTLFIPFLGLVLMTVLGVWVSQPHTPQFKYHQAVAYVSSLVVLIIWYWLNGRLYAKRLEIGRDLVAKREWKQAVVCLEPFNAFGGRRLDGTGEAHYLLMQAYNGVGNKPAADKCRQFVLKYRPGPWSAKLGGKSAPAARSGVAETVEQAKPRPPKSKPKRRF
jgi:hypothetical protein